MLMQRSHHLGITLPITTESKRIAKQFAEQCPFPEKAAQIERNTLAVCAVNAYLQLMDIPTSPKSSDSWSPMMQMMADVADLHVPGVGSFSCRPVDLDDQTCHIPPEDWQGRAGYIAIALNLTRHQATLIGFIEQGHEQEHITLNQFAPIEALIDRIHTLQAASQETSQTASDPATAKKTAAQQTAAQQTVQAAITQLGQWSQTWIEEGVTASWEAVETLISPASLGFAFRSTTAAGLASRERAIDISRAKLVDLGLQLGALVQVALVVHVTRSPHTQPSRDIQPNGSDIILQVRPLGDSPYLPEKLSLEVFDDNNNTIKRATSRDIDNYIQIQLSGESGELFQVHVAMGDVCFAETFII